MTSEPQIERREEQPYVGVPATVTMETMGQAADDGFGALFAWLAEHRVTMAGAPFIRFLVIDMAADLEIELAVPVASEVPVSTADRVRSAVLPGGRYATLLHTGPYDGLVAANDALQRWAERQGVSFDSWHSDRGSHWSGRIERYLTDPSQEPDPAKWEVEVAYLVREDR